LLAAVIGGVVAPLVVLPRNVRVAKVENAVFYPISLIGSALCWLAVLSI